jgi:hypothetical protein
MPGDAIFQNGRPNNFRADEEQNQYVTPDWHQGSPFLKVLRGTTWQPLRRRCDVVHLSRYGDGGAVVRLRSNR